MVSWWPGDGNANDIIGGNHGTLQNGANFASGMVGQAFSFSGITLDPNTDPIAQGYGTEGTAPFRTGTRLAIDDLSSSDRRVFFRTATEIKTGTKVAVDLQIDPGSVTTEGEDTGVNIVLNGGANVGTEIRAACILRGGERRIALKTGGGIFSNGIAAD